MRSNIIKKGMLAAAAVLTVTSAMSQDKMQRGESIEVRCEQASLVREGRTITAALEMNLSDVKVKSNQAAVFVPMIVHGKDTLRLPGVGVYGRTRWYQFERSGLKPISGEGERSVRYSDKPNVVKYEQTVDYKTWMNGSELMVERTDYGCCAALSDALAEAGLAGYRLLVYEPELRFQPAIAEERKTRTLSGRAFVDFPVNLMVIYPEYRNNRHELAKIIGTIDSVRNDKDITVESIFIKGWASPESPWSNNTRLAKGRTEALKQYVQNLYSFDYGFIKTDYYPEDWIGLRKYVETSTLPHKYEILALIDDPTIEPDPKEWKLKSTYPEEYKFLLENVYPGLRHSDYEIEYTIKGYTDVAEIAELMKTHPSKLSLNEMYIYAATLEQGSTRYNEVMETAVMMYPSDETAILNAAYAAMQRDDLAAAERYLSKAGTSAEALYAKGVVAGLRRDYDDAIWLFEQAAAKGNDAAQAEIDKLNELQKFVR